MKSITRRTALLGGAALASTGVSERARAAGETLTLYNGQHRATTEAVVALFTRATGIPVTIRQGESAQLSNQIVEEGAGSPADLFYSEQSPPMASLDEKGLLLPADAAALEGLPAEYVSANGTWIGTCLRTRVVAYNKAVVKPEDLPGSVLAFATPAWKDRVAYVKRDGFQEQVMAIVTLKGRDAALAWLKGLVENGRVYNGNGAAMNAVEKGEIAVALVNNYYWFGIAREKGVQNMRSALHFVDRGDVGALVNISPAAVLKTAKTPALAQRFLAFLVGQGAQDAIVASSAEYPVRPGVSSPFALKPLGEIGPAVTPHQIGAAQAAYALMKEAGML